MLRAGVIGAGQAAVKHAEAYAAHEGATLVAVADPDRARGEALAAAHGARWHGSHTDMLDSEELDAISVCVPHDLHLPIAVDAAAAGVHILMEKPLATTHADAEAIVAAVDAAGVTLMLGFVHRFRTEVLEAKRLVASGAIGKPATVLDRFCAPGGAHPPAWVWERARAGGGVLMYGGIHALDRLLWLLDDDVASVVARAHRYGGLGDVEDGLVALLELRGGASAVLFENSPPYGRPGGWATELFGGEGAIRIQTGEWLELTSSTGTSTFTARDELHFEREIAEFVSSIVERREPSVPAAAGLRSLRVALAIYEAADRDERVPLPPS